jgi:hypothetical protein
MLRKSTEKDNPIEGTSIYNKYGQHSLLRFN